MKKIIFTIISLLVFISSINCYAKPLTYDRNQESNYGVKKNIDIQSNYNNIMKTPLVNADEKIYDFTDHISEIEKEKIRLKIKEFSEKNLIDFVFLSDSNPYPEESKKYCSTQFKTSYFRENNEKRATDFYNYNDFGINFKNYNGIVYYENLTADPCDGIYYYDMFVYGDIRRYLSEDDIYNLMKDLLPYKNEKRNYEGISNLLDNIELKIEENKNKNKIEENITTPNEVKFPWSLVIFDFIVSLIIVVLMIRKNTLVNKEKTATNYVKRGSLKITNKKDRVII